MVTTDVTISLCVCSHIFAVLCFYVILNCVMHGLPESGNMLEIHLAQTTKKQLPTLS